MLIIKIYKFDLQIFKIQYCIVKNESYLILFGNSKVAINPRTIQVIKHKIIIIFC
jgi:hypothetical protein